MNENPYQKYKEETVMTMTQGEMLLLLYDELVKRLRASQIMAEKERYDDFDANITRAEEIIRYLKDTLNFDYSISQELYRLYDFFLVELGRIQASRKGEEIVRIRTMAEELRDAFREAEKKVAQ